MEWLLDHWAQVCEGFLAAYGLIAIIVKVTPTKKDDKILNMLQPALNKLEEVAKKVETAAKSNGQPE